MSDEFLLERVVISDFKLDFDDVLDLIDLRSLFF